MMRRPKIILPLSILFIFIFIFIRIAGSEPRYIPDDNIALDCGTADNLLALDGRNWTGDQSNKDSRFNLAEGNSSSYRATEQKSSVETVPYMTARVSRSNFSYSFRVSVSGPKFIRLHFYPAAYESNLDLTNSFFSVRAGKFTLLKNFSASMVAEYNDSPAFAREFCVYVEESEQSIDLEFIPSSSSSSSYAFVNAIEIVSMPTELYYAPGGDPMKSPKTLGMGGSIFQSYSKRALETVHRLNVGGRSISQTEDTGMFREWSPDNRYFSSSGFVPFNTSMALNYAVTPNYTAPDEVYRTATSMGPDAERNKRSNLTWGLPVDRGFYYLVRLHFCLLSERVAAAGPEAQFFYVFISDWTAESQGNINWWTGGRGLGVPVYKDYVVNVPDKDSIFISLTTRPEKSIYDDALLNGIEVFKMSSARDQSLAGPNPSVNVTRNRDKPVYPKKESDSKRRVLILASSLAGTGFVLVAVTLAVLYMTLVVRKRKPRSSSKSKSGSTLPEELCRHFYMWEIEEATDWFSEDRVVGRGAFGKVYKGFIDGDKSKSVAVKRLGHSPGNHQGEKEFVAEIKFLSHLRHNNLVSLVGYCDEEGEMILVYAFMENGTLREHLYGDVVPLSWRARLEACLGAARGLQYLHTGYSGTAVIHRDIKTANILLDEKWVAKVADFGLSREGQAGGGAVSTVVKGTPGYLDPEYYNRQKLVDKSDVYSFGVVLFEALCGRKPLDYRHEDGKRSLSVWVRKCARDGTVYDIVDPFLKGKIAPECLKTFVEVADSCIRDTWDSRPSMGDVVEHLEFALKLQLEADAAAKKSGDDTEDGYCYPEVAFRIVDEYDLLGLRAALDGGEASFVSLETESANVFSETTAHDSQSKF